MNVTDQILTDMNPYCMQSSHYFGGSVHTTELYPIIHNNHCNFGHAILSSLTHYIMRKMSNILSLVFYIILYM